MFRTILVPLDGSPFAEHALPLALSIARRARAGLRLIRVHIPTAPIYAEGMVVWDTEVDEALLKREEAYLELLLQRLRNITTVPLTSALAEGPVATALVQEATTSGADLVIMTTHGRGPLARAWLGSVADELVRQLPAPALLVRPGPGAPDLTEDPTPSHVLIPLDGSELAEQILEPALALAILLQADVTLLRAVKPMLVGNLDPADLALSWLDQEAIHHLERLHEQDREGAQAYLDQVAARLRGKVPHVQSRVVVHDQPAVAILEEVKERRADLVALATHGRSGLPRMFLGSVADKVLRGATVPLLVGRPPGK
jgi:nucleotide-binding universal stress UspA family protein